MKNCRQICFSFVHIMVEIENEFLLTVREENFLNQKYKSVWDFNNLLKKYYASVEEINEELN